MSSRLVRDDVGLLFVVRWRVGIVGLGRRGLATRRGSRELDGDLARRFRGRVRLDLINAALGDQCFVARGLWRSESGAQVYGGKWAWTRVADLAVDLVLLAVVQRIIRATLAVSLDKRGSA